MRRFLSIALVLLFISTFAFAHGGKSHNVMGTVTMVGADNITVKATDQFGNDIDLGVLENLCGIVSQQARRYVDTTIALKVPNGDFRDLNRHADTMPDQFCVFSKDAECAGSYCSQTDEPDIDLLFHLIAFLFSASSGASTTVASGIRSNSGRR